MRSRGSHSDSKARAGDCPLGIALAAGFATSIGGCLLASLTVPAHQLTGRLIVVCACVAGYAATVPNVRGAILTVVMAWSMYLGFIVERAGELRWHGGVDLLRLGMLMVAVLIGFAWRLTTVLLSDGSEPPDAGRPWMEPPAMPSWAVDWVQVPTQHPTDQ